MTSIAIKGSWVVGWGENGHQVIEDGVVVTKDDRIAFVGSQGDPNCPTADRVIDATGMLVSPGLINLHAIANLDLQVLHIDGPEDANFPKAESFVMDPDAPFILTDEEYRVSADFSVATLLKSGCTTFANVTTSASKRWEDTARGTLRLGRSLREDGRPRLDWPLLHGGVHLHRRERAKSVGLGLEEGPEGHGQRH